MYLISHLICVPSPSLSLRGPSRTATLGTAPRSWNNASTGDITYRGQLDVVNMLLDLMVNGTIGGPYFPDFYSPYNFTLAKTITSDAVSADSPPYECERIRGGRGAVGGVTGDEVIARLGCRLYYLCIVRRYLITTCSMT